MTKEFNKSVKVVSSCNNLEQLQTAKTYIELFKDKGTKGLPENLYSEIVRMKVAEMYLELTDIILLKQKELQSSSKNYSDQL